MRLRGVIPNSKFQINSIKAPENAKVVKMVIPGLKQFNSKFQIPNFKFIKVADIKIFPMVF